MTTPAATKVAAVSTVAPPTPHELVAPGTWARLDFISDLHLSPDTPRTFEAWSAYMTHTAADAVFILGDLFEVWVGDDARDDVFEARCCEILKSSTAQRWVGFMRGNRDFLVGAAMLSECGVQFLDDPTAVSAFGARVLLSHGDELCLSDTDYQQFRLQVRSKAWQDAFLSKPLAERRTIARQLRDASEARKLSSTGMADWPDLDPEGMQAWLAVSHSNTLVHGHTHKPADEALAPGLSRKVLTDWDLDHSGSKSRAEVLRLTQTGFERLPLSAAA